MNPNLAIETARHLTGQPHTCMHLDGRCMICKVPDGLDEWLNESTFSIPPTEEELENEMELARQRGETGEGRA